MSEKQKTIVPAPAEPKAHGRRKLRSEPQRSTVGKRAALAVTAGALLCGVVAAGQVIDPGPSSALLDAVSEVAGTPEASNQPNVQAAPAENQPAQTPEPATPSADAAPIAPQAAAQNPITGADVPVGPAQEPAATAEAAPVAPAEPAVEPAPAVAVDDPAGAQAYAAGQLGSYGWSADQMQCLVTLWTKESDWSTTATNSSSGAYGIVQSLPAEKMASAGADYLTNYQTQINWGLGYIKDRYQSPCGALSFHLSNNWY